MATTARELEFLAEDVQVTIIPKFRQEEPYHFIGHDVGPFVPTLPVDVPLWLGLHLKKNKKCQIQAPEWMDPESLALVLEEEKDSTAFSDLPQHFIEIAQLLMKGAKDDIPSAQRVQLLVEDISNIRQRKIRDGIKNVMQRAAEGKLTNAIKMNNVAMMEIHAMRPLFLKSLGDFHAFGTAADFLRPPGAAARAAPRRPTVAAASARATAAASTAAGGVASSGARAAQNATMSTGSEDVPAPSVEAVPRRKIRRFR